MVDTVKEAGLDMDHNLIVESEKEASDEASSDDEIKKLIRANRRLMDI